VRLAESSRPLAVGWIEMRKEMGTYLFFRLEIQTRAHDLAVLTMREKYPGRIVGLSRIKNVNLSSTFRPLL
jgi:hypothetical protein